MREHKWVVDLSTIESHSPVEQNRLELQAALVILKLMVSIEESKLTNQDFLNGSTGKNLPAMQETQELKFQYLGWTDPLEEEMGTYSSILTWKIPTDREA